MNEVVAKAVELGALQSRLVKQFRCFLPDKKAESDANPKTIHVDCSTANTDYAGQYITLQIAWILLRTSYGPSGGPPDRACHSPEPFPRRRVRRHAAPVPGTHE